MPGTQVIQGKAFEYACTKIFHEYYDAEIEESDPVRTARGYYQSLPLELTRKFDAGAKAGLRIIDRLEPRLKDEPFVVSMATDAQGMVGDVRDIILSTRRWQIGISCKHGNEDAKHSRLSDLIDFGREWLDYPVSREYWDTVKPIFYHIRQKRAETPGALWTNIPTLYEDYYEPVLRAFCAELRRIDEEHDDVPERLTRYLVGRKDYYKLITFDSRKYVRVEAFNMDGTLNKRGNSSPQIRVPVMEMPRHFYHIDVAPRARNWAYIACDSGWTFGIRIHTASSKIEPSLKLAISIDARPIKSLYLEIMPWNEEEG